MKNLKEWRDKQFKEDTADPITADDIRKQQRDFYNTLRVDKNALFGNKPSEPNKNALFGNKPSEPNKNALFGDKPSEPKPSDENSLEADPTQEDKLQYDQEMSGRMGTLLRLFMGAVFQKQQIFRRPAMLYMFLRNVVQLANSVSGNPSLVNRILLKIRSELVGSEPGSIMPQELSKAMQQQHKVIDPNTGKITNQG